MNKLTVCFFGSYDRNFTSNKIIYTGLTENGAEVVIVNSHTPVTRLDSEKDATFFHLIRRTLRKYRIVTEILKNLDGIRRSDVIYVGYPGHIDVIPAWFVAKIFRKKLVFNPLIIIYTGLTEEQKIVNKDTLFAKLIKFGETLIYRACDIVLADTPFQKEHLIHEFGLNEKKIRILPIGADDKIYPYAPKLGEEDIFNVVYYGLYSPIHGVEYLIKAAKLVEEDKNIKFIFVGNGNTYEKDYALAQNLKLRNVIFYKNMTEKDAFETLRESDVFTGFLIEHPVVKRVVPNKVYQGLSLGKTVLTAFSPAIEGVLKNKRDVYLVKPNNALSIARAIKDLKKNPKLHKSISENGHKLFIENLRKNYIGRDLLQYLREIV